MKQFTPFEKIARLSREIVITEKIDGTNALIEIERMDKVATVFDPTVTRIQSGDIDGDTILAMRCGSRNRWIGPGDDNAGFAAWCYEHGDELFELGEGRHFGEWWGQGIQRKYGQARKRLSLFNVGRWADRLSLLPPDEGQQFAPMCCDVVPVLVRDTFDTMHVDVAMAMLRRNGSYAAPGFMNPGGIVIFHTASRQLFKKTLTNDEVPKGKVAA